MDDRLKDRFRWVSIAIWLTLVISFWVWLQREGLSPLEAVAVLVQQVQTNAWGPIGYVLFYIFQPIIFFPSTLLSVAAGYLFGPFWGTALAVVGSNLSSVLAYGVGRYVGQGVLPSDDKAPAWLARYRKRLDQYPFETVLLMRLIYLPYDLVSYLSGGLRISLPGFVLGTFLGGFIGSLSFALFGSSIEGEFTGQLPSIHWSQIAWALVLVGVSLGLSRWLRRRESVPGK